MIIDRIMDYRSADRQVPADFGVRIHSGNIEAQLASINARRLEFLEGFPKEVAGMRRIVGKAGALGIVR